MPLKDEPNTVTAPVGARAGGNGLAAQVLNAAMGALGLPYVWGGTSLESGADCSGLIYAAYNAAGFDIPRYRAVDYGTHVGRTVSMDQARPGDIVYFDNPGDVDHVGIYMGSGKFIEAQQDGVPIKISDISGRTPTSIRRVLPDNAWDGQATDASGNYIYRYDGQEYTSAKRFTFDDVTKPYVSPMDLIPTVGSNPMDWSSGSPQAAGAPIGDAALQQGQQLSSQPRPKVESLRPVGVGDDGSNGTAAV